MLNVIDEEYSFVRNKKDYKIVLNMTDSVCHEYSYANAIFNKLKFYDYKNNEIDITDEISNNIYISSLYECFIQSRFCNHKHIKSNKYGGYNLNYETEKELLENDCKILEHLLDILPETIDDLKIQFKKYIERKNRKYNNEEDFLLKLNELYRNCLQTFFDRDYIDDEDCDEREILHISEYEQNKIDFLRYCIEYFKKDKTRPFSLIIHRNNNSLLLRELSKTILKTIGIDVITL